MSQIKFAETIPPQALAPSSSPEATKEPKTKPSPTTKKTVPTSTKAAPVGQGVVEAQADKDAKTKKQKLVRDSFTIPKDEYVAIEELKQRALNLSHPAKKSELIRAGIKLLTQLDDAALLQAMQTVPAIKTGRPKAEKK